MAKSKKITLKDSSKKYTKSTKSNGKFKSKGNSKFSKKDGISNKGKKIMSKKKKYANTKKIIKPMESKEVQEKEEEKSSIIPEKKKKYGNKNEKTDKKRKLPPEEAKEDTEDSKTKKKKPRDEVIANLMSIYETLRTKKTSVEEKKKLIEQVFKISSQKQNELIFKHDTVRVIEMCVKFGNEQQREQFFQLFKDNTVSLATSKYGKFLVDKLLEYGTKSQKKIIIESFYGKIKKLIKHKGASSIIDNLYDKYTNASQRSSMVEEFYGPEFAVFKVASGRTIEDILENEPTKKEIIMRYMKDTLSILVQKEVVRHSIIHRVLYDYFKYADLAQKISVIEVLKEAVVHILHTKEGARVAMNCLWHGTRKDRKSIIKSFKTYVTKICKEEYGHLVLLALFDVIDDTVLVKKVIFNEMLSNLQDIMTDQYGRKVLLYLLKPRSKSYFLPDVTQLLEQGDGNSYSKKDPLVRQEELRNTVLQPLVDALVPHIKDILFNKSASILLLATLEVSTEEQGFKIMETVIDIIKKPLKFNNQETVGEENTNEEVKSNHPVCDPCGHWVLKSIIKQDKKRLEKGWNNVFSTMLCEALPMGSLEDWASTNRSAFVLISLLESGIESVTSRVKEDLKTIATKTNYENKGLEILKKLLMT